MSTNGRNGNGTFAAGNGGGPGRPRRAVEQEYLATLGNVVTLDSWREIVERALVDAKAGDAKARAWLAEVLLRGANLMALSELAAKETAGVSVDDAIAQKAAEAERRQQWAEKTFNAIGKLT